MDLYFLPKVLDAKEQVSSSHHAKILLINHVRGHQIHSTMDHSPFQGRQLTLVPATMVCKPIPYGFKPEWYPYIL